MITETFSKIVKILSYRDLKIQSFLQEDKKSGKRYNIRKMVNALYTSNGATLSSGWGKH